jgi:hypothetical protein
MLPLSSGSFTEDAEVMRNVSSISDVKLWTNGGIVRGKYVGIVCEGTRFRIKEGAGRKARCKVGWFTVQMVVSA